MQELSLLDQLVEQALAPDELRRRIELSDLAPVEDDDAVVVEDRVDPMGDCDDGAAAELLAPQRRLQECVGLDVDGGLDQGTG